MRVFTAIFIMKIFQTCIAFGQVLKVTTGEHDSFSRIVVPISQDLEWSTRMAQGQLHLSVASDSTVYDVSTVFERIPRTRILSISQSGPGADLIINIGCSCKTKAFRASNSLVAIDILDSGINDNIKGYSIPLAYPNLNNYQFIESAKTAIPRKHRALEKWHNVNFEFSLPGTTVSQEEHIYTQIKRAQEQGVMSSNLGGAEITHNKDHIRDKKEYNRTELQVSAISAFDQEQSDMYQKGLDDKNPCIESNFFDTQEWVSDLPISKQVSGFRSKIFREFDQIDTESIEKLAAVYLNFGFGYEARQILDLVADPEIERFEILRSMASVVDGFQQTPRNPLVGLQHCAGPAALWSTLSENKISDDANIDGILFAFSALSEHLRAHFGPTLSEILASDGRTDAAKTILRNTTRIVGNDLPTVGMAMATVSLAEEDYNEVLDGVGILASEDTEQTARALITQVKTLFETGGHLPSSTSELIDAYIIEHRDSAIISDLKKARILAFSMEGRFEISLPDLSALYEKNGDIGFVSDIMSLLTIHGSDLAFLEYVITHQKDLSKLGDIDVPIGIARRLLDLGFPSPVKVILASRPGEELDDPRRLLLAEAALDEGQPHRALVTILGIDGLSADKIRISAMWQNQNYSEAAELAAQMRDLDNAARGAFLAGDYVNTPKDVALYSSASQAAQSLTSEFPETLPPLQKSKALLDGSVSVRKEIENLLGYAQLPLQLFASE